MVIEDNSQKNELPLLNDYIYTKLDQQEKFPKVSMFDALIKPIL